MPLFAWILIGLLVLIFGGLRLAWVMPRFHCGRPENPGELQFRQQGVLFQSLRLKWWCGLSSRRRAKWFLGLMAWDRNSDW